VPAGDQRPQGGPIRVERQLRVDAPASDQRGVERLARRGEVQHQGHAAGLAAAQPHAPHQQAAMPYLVAQPPVQLVEARRDAALALLGAPAGGLRVGWGLAGGPSLAARGGSSLALVAPLDPFGHPVGQARRGGHRPVGPQQQQAEHVLAGELATRAGAAVGRAREVDVGPIRLGAAAHAVSPDSGVAVGGCVEARARPRVRSGHAVRARP